MLKYFVMSVETLITAAIIVGALRGFASVAAEKAGRIVTAAGSVLGIAGACVMAYMKNATKLIDTSLWNMYIFGIFAALTVLFFFRAAHRKAENGGQNDCRSSVRLIMRSYRILFVPRRHSISVFDTCY